MSQIPPPEYTPQPAQGMHDTPDRVNPIYLVLLAAAAIALVFALYKFNDSEDSLTVVVETTTTTTVVETTTTVAGGGATTTTIAGGATTTTTPVETTTTTAPGG